jgi:hypothetical protein
VLEVTVLAGVGAFNVFSLASMFKTSYGGTRFGGRIVV